MSGGCASLTRISLPCCFWSTRLVTIKCVSVMHDLAGPVFLSQQSLNQASVLHQESLCEASLVLWSTSAFRAAARCDAVMYDLAGLCLSLTSYDIRSCRSQSASGPRGSLAQRAARRSCNHVHFSCNPVSYTHLTLPTIYSV